MPSPFRPLLPVSVLLSVAGLAALLSGGCADMPVAPPGGYQRQPPRLVAGPYLDGAQARPTLRMLLDQPATVAVRHAGAVERVERDGSFTATPAVRVEGLNPDRRDRLRLLIANREGPELELRAPPPPETTAPVRLLLATQTHAGELEALARALDPDALVLLPPVDGYPAAQPSADAADLLKNLGEAAWRSPLHLVANAHVRALLTAEVFPAVREDAWRRQVGPVALYGLDLDALADPLTRDDARDRLRKLFREPTPHARWRIACLSRAPFAGQLDTELILGLGDELETAGVTLAVAPGRDGYWRTHPLSGSRGGQTVMVALGQDHAAGIAFPTPAFVAAAEPQRVAAGLLTAVAGAQPELRWETFAPGATTPAAAPVVLSAPGPVYAKQGLMEEAATLSSVRAELARVASQAARAVTDPHRPLRLPVAVENTVTRPLGLRLSWLNADAPDRRWSVEPATTELAVEPGRGALAWFRLTPAGGANDLVLRVDAGDAGTVEERLILAPRRTTPARFTDRPVTVNGRFNDIETAWAGFPAHDVITDFVGEAPERRTRARLAYDARGLLVAFECAIEGNARNTPTRASDPLDFRDHPDILLDEGVEIWVDPANRGRDWRRFAVNAVGARYDQSSRDGRDFDATWEAAIGRDSGRYRVEIRLPWKALGVDGPPENGAQWAVNLVRRDASAIFDQIRRRQESPPPRRSEWADTFGRPERSGLFGAMTFTGPAIDALPEAAGGDLAPDEPAIFFPW